MTKRFLAMLVLGIIVGAAVLYGASPYLPASHADPGWRWEATRKTLQANIETDNHLSDVGCARRGATSWTCSGKMKERYPVTLDVVCDGLYCVWRPDESTFEKHLAVANGFLGGWVRVG